MPSKKKPTTTAKPPGKAKASKSATPASEKTGKGPQKAGKKARARKGPVAAKSSSRPTVKKQTAGAAPKKRVGVVRKVAGGLLAGALKGVASVVEKVAGIDEGADAGVSREIARVREEVTSAKAAHGAQVSLSVLRRARGLPDRLPPHAQL